ncbi:hypothetical protein AVBRAN12640_09710 [Campylobacter sp. RM12640]|uniref:rolling circle replication-associated protein n=1 Tax=unclassified Campylobacter TaxID=2593542 RepID=UPI003014AB6E|nr:hypothetical protein [Campylobacter sp. RM12640]MBZ7990103.1 hypothetical protein [Campylobacter sp. RM12635]
MIKYGISDYDLYLCQIKLLKSFTFQACSKLQDISNQDYILKLKDISYNANINIKYSYELLNIINSYNDFNITLHSNIPLFITITLDGCYRRMVKGDYSEFNETRLKKEFPKHLRHKYYLELPLTIKECYEILNYQHKKMRDRYLNKYKDVKHDFIKVPEPHKNGIPHIHALWFIPNDKSLIKYLKKIFKECCPAPQNHSQKGLTIDQKRNKETQGFQLSVSNSTGYIVKYIFKTFRNIHKNDFKINKLNAWYIHHKIRRLTRSHIKTYNNYNFSLGVYRKLRGFLYSLGYKNISLVLWEFFNDENCFIKYNLNPKKGDIFINLGLRFVDIYYTKKETIIIKYLNNEKTIIKEKQVIKNKTYVLLYDKEILNYTYKLYYEDFISA